MLNVATPMKWQEEPDAVFEEGNVMEDDVDGFFTLDNGGGKRKVGFFFPSFLCFVDAFKVVHDKATRTVKCYVRKGKASSKILVQCAEFSNVKSLIPGIGERGDHDLGNSLLLGFFVFFDLFLLHLFFFPLLELDGDNRYVFIGSEIFAFSTDGLVQDLLIPIVKSDVPYPYCVTATSSYFLLDYKKTAKSIFPEGKLYLQEVILTVFERFSCRL
jgi:hypothetical protein